jgi:hypothetical protein
MGNFIYGPHSISNSNPTLNRTRIVSPEFTLTDNFEGAEDTSFWGLDNGNVRRGVASQDLGYLGKVMAFDFAGSAPGGDARAEQPFNVTNCLQIEIAYREYIPANYVHRVESPGNNKVLVLRSDGGGATSTSNHAMVIECSESVSGVTGSTPDMANGGQGYNSGHCGWFPASPNYDNYARIYREGTAGYWQDVAIYYVLPENDQEFGRSQMWIDDVIVLDTELNMDIPAGAGGIPTSEQIIFHPTANRINYGYLKGAANSGFLVDTTMDMSDFTFKSRSSSVGATY